MTTTTEPTPRPLLDILVEQAGLPAKPPRGRHYGLKAVHADLESSRGYYWPFPGQRATSPKKPKVGGPCPVFEGDGLCVALTAEGARQGGHRLSTVLLVSYTKAFGSDPDKVRVGWADVIKIFDIPKLARLGFLSRANLSRANLSGANLSGAYLPGAYLPGANLSRANLSGANLSGAYLSGAYLSGAYLSRANLSGANLSGANLSRANLSRADLSGADLSGADLSGADLSGADLSGAYLSGANLSRANLSGARGVKR